MAGQAFKFSSEKAHNGDEPESRFLGKAVRDDEARQKWPQRYQDKKQQAIASKSSINEDGPEEVLQARCHYTMAEVDGHIMFNLYDGAYVEAGDAEQSYICRVVEMFESVDGTRYFTAQWFYRAKDTFIKDHAHLIDDKRVFLSEIKDDNPLDCLLKKLRIIRVPLNVDLAAKRASISFCDYYYDMMYLLPYSTFMNLPPEDNTDDEACDAKLDSEKVWVHQKSEMSLLDLYSGCGAMSTGLCLGAITSGLNLVTRWAVDMNAHACSSLSLNHPETKVRNESVEDFLSLLKEWEDLCITFSLISGDSKGKYFSPSCSENECDGNDADEGDDFKVLEVARVLAIYYAKPKDKGQHGLYFKVRWKGYGPSEDSWEPIERLSGCRESIMEFVKSGFKSKIIPLPGDVDVICGGPPCQGISGFNRFRNSANPLDDPKNKQLLVFMDVVDYLKPKFVLMENVVDIVKFAGGFLGRYALGRFVQMNYQTRMGMLVAGAYGLPQFRMRVFMWGARPMEKLPPYPLPTHDVVVRGVLPLEFENNAVAYNESHNYELERKLLLKDAISDLPPVKNNEGRDEMPYGRLPQTEFQRFIRLRKDASESNPSTQLLYDHRPLQLNKDDYERVCRIPKRKGANFRDLPGVCVREDNKVEFDPSIKRVRLKSGKPLVPDYTMSFKGGSSKKPFGRLWWDETVPTVVTRAKPHNQIILHPEQDRVLTVRENARLQGFPDYYRLCGPVEERYTQVGNAVAVPVARALGCALGLACQGSSIEEPLIILPPKFPNILQCASSTSLKDLVR